MPDKCMHCLYPANTRPILHLDLEGVCSGCRAYETLSSIDWSSRSPELEEVLHEYKVKARAKGARWDVLTGVSGGKDSHYQVHVLKNVYGLNPLTMTFNHCFNSRIGLRNLSNLVTKFSVDNVRVSIPVESARRIARHMLMEIGDITYAYHPGCLVTPMKVAARYRIPLVVWGDQGWTLMHGMFQPDEYPEWTTWQVLEHDMRGIDPNNLVGKGDPGWEITEADVAWFEFPGQTETEELGLRGIYLSSYLPWDGHEQAKFMHESYGFELMPSRGDTFLTYSKTDDYANAVHSYLKYLKFGYGRGTDDASTEIRAGRITREEGLELAEVLDPQYPAEWAWYLQWLQLDEGEVLGRLQELADGDVMERWEQSNTSAVVSNRVQEKLEEGKPYYTSPVVRTPRAMVTGKGGFEVL